MEAMSDTPTITPRPNGPYVVTNCRLLRRLGDGRTYASERTMALCRCGGSKNKPFCDGTHARVGFSGARADDRVPDARDAYTGRYITIHDNRGICAHAARCTDTLTTVFRMKQEPWIDPDGDTAERIVATVEQCPSGALSYTIDGVEHRDRQAAPMILVVPDGPYAVRGGADLQGVEWGDGASREHFTLCRCGYSRNKPFCSGAHWDHQFDEEAAKKEV
jgi:CDGSH-type Zn-finger protein